MNAYSNEERIDMLIIIGECLENCLLASRVYAQRFPHRDHPKKDVFERLLGLFRHTGSVQYAKRAKSRPVTGNEDTEFAVIASVIENPHTSQNQIARNINISQASVSRILKRNHYYPFKIQIHQELYGNDFMNRVEFCMWVMDQVAENENFFNFVLFSDECTFHNNGFVNRHNCHYYSDINPHHFIIANNQHRWALNVWGGIMGEYVIGPYFFQEHLDGILFLNFLRNQFPVLLENIPLDIRRSMWLQLDGAPAHFHRGVREFLNIHFENRWIGRSGYQNWPARSPDLTPPDFFLWGYIKGIVYNTPPTTPENMMERIRDAFQSISPEILRKVKDNFQKRVQLCLESDGHHFEHLL